MANWRADRALNLARATVFATIFGLLTGGAIGLMLGPLSGFLGGITGAIVFGIPFGLGIGRHHSWLAYVIATRHLARRKRLPRKLMRFLDDAHRVGLLRTVGPVYQFRHAELQDHFLRVHRDGSTRA